VVLSGLSAILGLGREVLVIGRLGLSASNDALQFALSITYTVALLGEPLRLAALNLLQRRLGLRLWLVIGCSIVVAATVMTLLYTLGPSNIPPSWTIAAGAAGAANLFFAWVLPRRQRSGPFLPVHFVTVMPNIVMVAVLLLPAPSDQVFAARVVGLFLVAPLLQLAALAVLDRFGDHPELQPPPSTSEGLRPIAWHAVGAAGGQASQLLIRTALLAGPPGALSGFTTVLRVTDTLRAIFVDTYIASRVRRWAAGERSTSPLVDGRWLTTAALTVICIAGLLVALTWKGMHGTLGKLLAPGPLMVVLGAYLVLALRVRYQSLNTSAQPVPLVKRMAGIEIGSAATVGILSLLAGVPVAALLWVVYVARPAAGLALVSIPIGGGPVLAPEA
jgi:hypothetical protein